MRFLTERMLHEGEALPFWYGVTYRDPSMRGWVCHPVPLNFLVRWGRNLWWFLAQEPKPDALERAFEAGRETGCRQEQRIFGIKFDSDIKELNRWRSWAMVTRQLAEDGDRVAVILAENPQLAHSYPSLR